MLTDLLSIVKKLGYAPPKLLIDKIDEDNRLLNDSENISKFISPLLTDNKLLLNRDIQLLICIWIVAYNNLRDIVRTQKFSCYKIHWSKADLIEILNKRLSVFSKNIITSYKQIFESTLSSEELDQIFELANFNPRDLCHIMNAIINAQYKIDRQSTLVCMEALRLGIKEFVQTFNYYEYYPKRANAYRNSMDVYSYTAHLQKLDDITFTKNKLDRMAKTGGSTNNYVIGMEKIGLIKKVDQKSGNAIYCIADPKVIYAMKNGIVIEK